MVEEDDPVDHAQSAEIEGVGINEEIDTEDNDGVIAGDVAVLPSPLVDEPYIVDVEHNVLTSNDEDIVNENAHKATCNEGVPPDNDIEQAEIVGARRSSRVPNTRF